MMSATSRRRSENQCVELNRCGHGLAFWAVELPLVDQVHGLDDRIAKPLVAQLSEAIWPLGSLPGLGKHSGQCGDCTLDSNWEWKGKKSDALWRVTVLQAT